jgi:hypothetical protein
MSNRDDHVAEAVSHGWTLNAGSNAHATYFDTTTVAGRFQVQVNWESDRIATAYIYAFDREPGERGNRAVLDVYRTIVAVEQGKHLSDLWRMGVVSDR